MYKSLTDWATFSAPSMQELMDAIQDWHDKDKTRYIKIKDIQTHCLNNEIQALVRFKSLYELGR